jgi:sialate O-acetylesterase
MYQWSDWSKRHFRQGYWEVCTPETVRDLSAIGYVFGRRLHKASGVPIGLVDASIGGTTVETWTSREAAGMISDPEVREMLADWQAKVAEFDPKKDFEERLANYEKRVADKKKQGQEIPARWKRPEGEQAGPVADRNRPGNCFQGLIEPLQGIQVKGVIFHQGFNNCFSGSKGARIYREIFPVMIGSWRKAFADPELPFGIISLCTAGMAQTEENYCEMMVDVGPEIREAQYQTFRQLVDSECTSLRRFRITRLNGDHIVR